MRLVSNVSAPAGGCFRSNFRSSASSSSRRVGLAAAWRGVRPFNAGICSSSHRSSCSRMNPASAPAASTGTVGRGGGAAALPAAMRSAAGFASSLISSKPGTADSARERRRRKRTSLLADTTSSSPSTETVPRTQERSSTVTDSDHVDASSRWSTSSRLPRATGSPIA